MASIEMYLKALTPQEIVNAQARSIGFASPKDCTLN